MLEKIEVGRKILKQLNTNSYQAYFVGGMVRDLLLGREIHDIDIATNALPEEVMQIFPKSIPTGLKHGTVTIVEEGVPFEVTTFRKEGQYLDYRHPSHLEFVSSLVEDLKRRDFTINAMAMDVNGLLIDPFQGQAALKSKLVISVGKPKDRFLEDPLRIMRAIRFASQLQFQIEEETKQGILEVGSYLQYIAMERIKSEMDKIMASENPGYGISGLFELGLIQYIRGLKDTRFISLYPKELSELLSKTSDVLLRWVIIFYFLKEEERLFLLSEMKFSKKEQVKINKIFSALTMMQGGIQLIQLKRCLVELDFQSCSKAIEMTWMLGQISEEERLYWQQKLLYTDQDLKVRKIKDLAITGNDLLQFFNRPGGPWVRELLEELFEQVVYGQLLNDPKILLKKSLELKGDQK
ncbi:hypothetical protein U473_06010 [Tepidibacillus decaturensis]|uniref:CCA tRNA nucleotidyltransferase n=1 Tax=Tepidibacillus decaturensis TaxID=1413211 RepID=A0A135L3X7_9BACI|nr:hypothetical protein U473_06010 [Tepidibacillus decaturensis]